MTNQQLAQKIIQESLELGVRTFCICPGGRNAPLVESLSLLPSEIDCRYFFDERAASFFALGRARRDKAPVAIVTTSGTAVTEMLSAAVEAHYTNTPLLFISADRPSRFRGTGAPQTIEQVQVFSNFVEGVLDADLGDFEFPFWSQRKPMHWNVAFEEPLMDGPALDVAIPVGKRIRTATDGKPPPRSWIETLKAMKRPLVIVSGLENDERVDALETLHGLQVPIYVEGTSGLRGHADFESREVFHGKRIQRSLRQGDFGGVIRLGSVPTARFWRDLETLRVPVVSLGSLEFPGGTASCHFQSPSNNWKEFLPESLGWDSSAVFEKQNLLEASFRGLLKDFPQSEWGWFFRLSQKIKKGHRLFVGNSLPIRNWDLAADRRAPVHVHASRGANGIDGQLATALGGAEKNMRNWAILGDLTTIYDMSSMLLAQPEIDFKLVVINNQGGQIFSQLFSNPVFQNPQKIDFQSLARSMGWQHSLAQGDGFAGGGRQLIELRPDPVETQNIQQRYGQLCEL